MTGDTEEQLPPEPQPPLRIECAGLTDPGRVRRDNQDQFLIADLSKGLSIRSTSLDAEHLERFGHGCTGKLMIVADGMGGHRGGQEASALAVDSLLGAAMTTMRWCIRLEERSELDFEDDLRQAMNRCQEIIQGAARGSPQLSGMGTTLTMAYVIGRRLYIVHAGDSRCYLLRKGEIAQLTTDHTMAQKLVQEGVLEASEAETSRLSHVLWNALGGSKGEVQPEVRRASIHPGDMIFLCSDGLNRHVDDETAARILGDAESAEDACMALVAAANAGGGSDNITVLVARMSEEASA